MTALSGQRGQSLIQLLISIGLMGILISVFASVTNYQQREMRAQQEVLASMDLQKTLTAALADGSVCNYVLNKPSPLTFDSRAITAGKTQTITLSQPLRSAASATAPVVAQVGTLASPYSSSLIVKAIQLDITSGSGTSYIGNWTVSFDPSKTVRSVRPVSVSTTLTADLTNPGAAKIVGCQSEGRTLAALGTCAPGSVMNGYQSDGSLSCIAAAPTGNTNKCTGTKPRCNSVCGTSGFNIIYSRPACTLSGWICAC